MVFFLCLLADQIDVITDQGGDTGGINKDSLRRIMRHDVINGVVKLFFSTENNIIQEYIGGKAHLGEIASPPTGPGGTGFPGGSQTGHGTVNKMCGIGIREQGYLCPLEGTSACCRSRGRCVARNLPGFVVRAGTLYE